MAAPNSTIWTSSSGYVTCDSNTSIVSDGMPIVSDLVDFVDILYQAMGVDMTYTKYTQLSQEEKDAFRRSLLRDAKIQKIVE